MHHHATGRRGRWGSLHPSSAASVVIVILGLDPCRCDAMSRPDPPTTEATEGAAPRPRPPPMPLLPFSTPATIERCRSLQLKGNEIFICTAPKSATTWTGAIVQRLLTRGQVPPGGEDWHLSEWSAFYEAAWIWDDADATGQRNAAPVLRRQAETGRRVFNTHLRWDMLPTGADAGGPGASGARFIYVNRDGRDAVTSFYHHLGSMALKDGGFEGSWEEFFDLWCDGKIGFGAWIDHLVDWHGGPAAKDPRVLFLTYEGMKADLRGAVGKIATHLGLSDLTSEELDLVAHQCSFSYMAEHRVHYEPRAVGWRDPTFQFIRKGEVGDHAARFTRAQHRRFAESLFERYAMIMGEEVRKERGVLPSYVTDALVGGFDSLVLDDGQEEEDQQAK